MFINKALLLSVMALIGSVSPISAAEVNQARLALQAPVMAISRQGDTILSVGDRGHIFKFNQQKWSQVASPSDVLFTNIFQLNQVNAWAVGHDLTIVATKDGGNTWQLQQQLAQSDRPLLDINFIDRNNGYAIGAYGTYFNTTDGGKSWTKQFLASLLPQDDIEYLAEIRAESEEEYQYEISSILPHFNKIIRLQNGSLMMVGELGLIALSDDGQTWQRLDNIYDGSFFSDLETRKNTLLVAGLRGNLFRSIDQGKSWHKINLPNSFSVNDLRQQSNGDIYLAQNNGILLKSSDDGESFSVAVLYKGHDLLGNVTIDNKMWLATSKGLVQVSSQHQVKQ